MKADDKGHADCGVVKEKETAKLAGMVSVLDSIIMDEFQW